VVVLSGGREQISRVVKKDLMDFSHKKYKRGLLVP